jgi:amino acid transporter
VAQGWSSHFQEFIPIFHEGLSWIPAKLPDAIRSSPINYCVNVGAGCPHTGFVTTGSYLNLPAILITLILTVILVKGIKESATFNACMVAVKLVIVLMVIAIGGYLIVTVYGTANWHPFAPYGYTGLSFFGKTIFGKTASGGEPLGMFAGAAIIFFAYIGFDLHHPLHSGFGGVDRNGSLPGNQNRRSGCRRVQTRWYDLDAISGRGRRHDRDHLSAPGDDVESATCDAGAGS